MDIKTIDSSGIDSVARFMSTIKPEWWDYDGAYQQLQDVSLLAGLVGWYMENATEVKGWILCAKLRYAS